MRVVQVLLGVCLLHLSWAQSDCDVSTCPSDDVALLSSSNQLANEHYYIGAMFEVHEKGDSPYRCGKIRERSLINLEAFFWAIQRYQNASGLSGVVSVGGFAMDSCGRDERTVENVYSFDTCRTYYTNVSPRNTVAFVGPDKSTAALAAGQLMNELKRTQVSGAATSPRLSSSDYNFFLRTVPSDAVETLVMAQMLNSRNIRYVQVLYEDSLFGHGLLEAFEMNARAYNVCIVQKASIMGNNVAAFLGASKVTKIVVVLAGKDHSRSALQQIQSDDELRR